MQKLLQSRKFMMALISIAVYLVSLWVPEVAKHADLLGPVLVAIYVALAFGTTAEDAVTQWANRPKTTEDALRALIQEALDQLVPKEATSSTVTVGSTWTTTPPLDTTAKG